MPYHIYDGVIPYLTTNQMIEVDRAMIEDYGIQLIQMMENAGRNLAALARRRFLKGDPDGKRIIILAGTGGNGGGALVCGRRLSNFGAQVTVFITRTPREFGGVAAHQLQILERMKLSVSFGQDLENTPAPDLIIDGLIGYSLNGAPHGRAASLIQQANQISSPILSLDAPSGLDTTTGTIYDPTIVAAATMTLALPKEGLRAPGAEEVVGELYLADISVPPQLYAGPGLNLEVSPIFAGDDIIRLS